MAFPLQTVRRIPEPLPPSQTVTRIGRRLVPHALPAMTSSLVVLLLIYCQILVTPADAESDVCSMGRAQWNPGAVARLGLSLSLRKADSSSAGGCGSVSQEALQLYVATQWVLEKLNHDSGNGSFVPGVQFGFDLLDDCRSPTRAIQYALDFVDLTSGCTTSDNTSAVLRLGLVGPTRSSTAEEVADAMRSLPFPIISPAATLASLTEGPTAHANFYRTVPSDNLQIEVIVSILKQQRWTYVAVVYTEDNYGTMGARTLQEKAASANICINASLAILVPPRDNLMTVVSQLTTMLTRTQDQSLAVVYIGEKDRAENLLFNIRTRSVFGFHFIMSDSVSTNMDVFQSGQVENGPNVALGSLTLVPTSVVFNDFVTYLNQKYRDVREGKIRDPQIEAFVLGSEWKEEKVRQIPFVPLTVGAVFALAEATRLAHEDLCEGRPGACQKLLEAGLTGAILDRIKNISVDFSKMPNSMAPETYKTLGYVLEFDDNGDVVPKAEIALYTVLAFDDNKEKPYLNVGRFSSGNLALDMSSVRMLTWEGEVTEKLQTSVCAGSCQECTGRDIILAHLPAASNSEPAPYIIGIFSIHEQNSQNAFKCGDFRNVSNDVVVLEAFLHAVKKLRETTKINFAAVAFDDCYSPLHITSILSDFLSGLVPYDKGLFDMCVAPEQVVGVVGCLSSDCTLATASFFTHLLTPVISYAASSPDLDDRVNYPYFLRTVPSDEAQAVAMTELILRMGWSYVGLLHVTNNYGTKGALAFQTIARARGVCVAAAVGISAEATKNDESDLDDQFKILLQQDVKVVVFFGIDTRIADMLRFIESRGLQGQILFVSSEEWAQKTDVLNAGPKAARGSITFKVNNMDVGTEVEDSLRTSLLSRTPSDIDPNPWFSELWQHVFDCNLPGGFNNIFSNVCSERRRLTDSQVLNMVSDQRVKHVMNAVHVLGHGLASTLGTVCEDEFPCDNLHEDKFAARVYKLIKSQTVKSGSRKEPIFDDNGNGDIGFTIYNVQRKDNTNQYVYEEVGSYSRRRGLQLWQENLLFYTEMGLATPSVDASCAGERCSHCTLPTNPQTTAAPVPQTDKEFRVADLVILIVLLAVCILLVCGMIFGFTYFRRKVKGLTKELQEHTKEPVYHEAQEPRVYRNVDSDRLLHPPAPCRGPASAPAPIRFVNSLDSRGNSPAGTIEGHLNPAFRSDSAGLHMVNAPSEQSLNHLGHGFTTAPTRPNRTLDPPLRQNGISQGRPNNLYASDPMLGVGVESEAGSSQHNYYMAHSESSVRELPALPNAATEWRSPQSHEHIPMQNLTSRHVTQQQQQQQQYINPCEAFDPRFEQQQQPTQSVQGGEMGQIQYFRMTSSGQLEEEDEEGEEEEEAVLNTYSLSPSASRSVAGSQYSGDPSGAVHDQQHSFSPNNSGSLPHIQMTPEIREILLQQLLAENLMQQQQHQLQQEQFQSQQQEQEVRVEDASQLQSPSSSSLGSSSSSQPRDGEQNRPVLGQYQYQQQQLMPPTSPVYPSSSSMSDSQPRSESALGSAHSSQPILSSTPSVPQYQKQMSTPAGGLCLPVFASQQQFPQAEYTSQSPQIRHTSQSPQIGHTSQSPQIGHTSQVPQARHTSQEPQSGVQSVSPYAQLAQVALVAGEERAGQTQADDLAGVRGYHSSSSEQGDSLRQASPRVRWTLDSLHSLEESSDNSHLEQQQGLLHQQQKQQLQQQAHQRQQQPQQQQPQRQQQEQPSEKQHLSSLGAALHITRV